ncbi:phosphoglycerate kinase [Archaeoglobus fulgidus]|jgi:phosphoglycerate kinase|nr:phosphoglycerate kinase [Archaeoglobus fulgidus]AIG98020.1 3-phosphoglycerate kinase [Archaeoglobus fulgidus DSM 8774]KUJ94079.1 MAG: Phosphoglycerate kinase [Archaeoglobus fulgidus]KUK07669.1 MAG: Phosphoglycerate kinase [Archaeoglobus fulgidus]
MIDGLPTLDDIPYRGKHVLLRVDINAPIVNSTILDTSRFESHIPTIEALEDSKLVLLAHQSRPGKKDFTSLESHASTLSKLLGKRVEYIDEIFSKGVLRRIKEMENGEVILLENVRFYSEEQLNRSAEEHAECHMVRKLSTAFDLFVNDAFSASHRSHASLVGFVPVLPSVVGRLVENEVTALSKPLKGEGRKIFVLGGAKIKDSVKVLKNVLENNIAEKVVLTGVVANYFLMLKGYDIGEVNRKVVEDNKEDVSDEEMINILKKYSDKIILPIDLGIEKDGVRVDIPLEKFDGKYRIMDIGLETVNQLSEIIPKYDYVVLNGPAGVFEDERFSLGTYEILRAATRAGYSVVGGGHIASAARLFGLSDKFSHISTAGGACIRFLSGEKLVALEVIKEYWAKKWGKS